MSQETQTQPNSSSELESVLAQLTPDQIRFVVARQECPTDKEAAESIEIDPSTVCYWKRKGAPVDDAVRLMAMDGLIVARHIRRRSLAKAMMVKAAGLDTNDERLRQNVATEIIEWEMGKATQKQEITGEDGNALHVIVEYVKQNGSDSTA